MRELFTWIYLSTPRPPDTTASSAKSISTLPIQSLTPSTPVSISLKSAARSSTTAQKPSATFSVDSEQVSLVWPGNIAQTLPIPPGFALPASLFLYQQPFASFTPAADRPDCVHIVCPPTLLEVVMISGSSLKGRQEQITSARLGQCGGPALRQSHVRGS